ncbi:MAG: hypothetical protein ACPLW8_03880 [Candidatus Bathyarchaeales archaeon]
MGGYSASAKMIDRVERCICEKFKKPEMVNPSRIEKRCGIDHKQAYAALESIAPHPGETGLWKICDGQHELVRISHGTEWWYACHYSEATHKTKYFEEKLLEDFGITIPPLSEIFKSIDDFNMILQKFDNTLKRLDIKLC